MEEAPVVAVMEEAPVVVPEVVQATILVTDA
jgi:hypothetical protein